MIDNRIFHRLKIDAPMLAFQIIEKYLLITNEVIENEIRSFFNLDREETFDPLTSEQYFYLLNHFICQFFFSHAIGCSNQQKDLLSTEKIHTRLFIYDQDIYVLLPEKISHD